MERDRLAEFETVLVGRNCVVMRREHDWTFDLSDAIDLTVSAPWRIVLDGRIALASGDHGHMFGLFSPVDGEIHANRLLENKAIAAVKVDPQTGDLKLLFDAGTRIDVFNCSAGYEGWQASYATDDGHRSAVALGGGQVAFVDG